MVTPSHINDSRAVSRVAIGARDTGDETMQFNATHAINLTREIRDSFGDESAYLGKIDMGYADGEFPCIYVEFFANGNRYLADVYADADGSVNWIC